MRNWEDGVVTWFRGDNKRSRYWGESRGLILDALGLRCLDM